MGQTAKTAIAAGFIIAGAAIFLSMFNSLLSMTIGQTIVVAMIGVGGYVLGKNT